MRACVTIGASIQTYVRDMGLDMWTVSDEDFDQLKAWGLDADPFQAVSDYSELRVEQRWESAQHRELWAEYIRARQEYIDGKDFDDYYKKAEKPIDRRRWEYLKARKAWYITPLGWDAFAEDSCVVADLGCGDGDTVQRLVDFVDQRWHDTRVTDRELHVVGIDLNASRIENARQLVQTSNPRITFEFHVGDIVGKGLDFEDGHFDYAMCNGVLEILADAPFERFLDEMCRVAQRGVYIEDLFDRFPGGYPRDTLGLFLRDRGFKVNARQVVFQTPFEEDRFPDPKPLWPMCKVQNLWAERCV